MNVPEGYTENEVLEIIDQVSSSLARKYVFGIYAIEDIKQEAFLLSLDAIKKFNGSIPLGVFLRKHLNNRLKDFKRDNSFRIDYKCKKCDIFNDTCDSCCRAQQTQDTKKNILSPIDIEVINNEKSTFCEDSLIDTLEMIELVDKINRRLPVEYREDYLRIKENLYVPKGRKEEIERIITEIIEDDE
jgi:DNA-directed RNA polymerase specialized sigma24 family protein